MRKSVQLLNQKKKKEEVEKKTSEQWAKDIKDTDNIVIRVYTGWDIDNFQYSFHEEKISADEFVDRCMLSVLEVEYE